MEEHIVRVVDRVFDIIEQLAASDVPMSLSDISKATGMSKSTVHRLLACEDQKPALLCLKCCK